MHIIDWIIIIAYAVLVLGMGWYYGRQQTSTAQYYTGGGQMRSGLIGISLYVTLLSTITYLATPGEMIRHGPVQAMFGMIALPFSFLIVGYLLIPVIMKQRVTSAYELLEGRLGLSLRMLGAAMFISLRLVWMSVMLYITATALIVILGLDEEWLTVVAAICGLVAVVYTSVGGLRTVVFTDLAQSILLFLGALVTIGLVTYRMGGFGWWPTEWVQTWDTQPVYSFDPQVRVTLLGTVLGTLVWYVCTAGGDQTAIQRYMATRDARTARRSYLITTGTGIVVGLTLSFVGLALLGYLGANPELLPADMNLVEQGDQIFPYFIGNMLPVGLSGLVVAALFAAAMSSIDSGVNSISAVVQTDFIDRFRGRAPSDREQLWLARMLAFGIGVVVVTASSVVQHVPGNFLETTQKTTNLFVTPIFVLFFLALFVPFATPVGALVGCVSGVATAVTISYWDVLTGMQSLSFQWIGPCSLAVNLVVSCLVSRFGPRPSNIKASLLVGVGLTVIVLLAVAGLVVGFGAD